MNTSQRILITGATGLIGSALIPMLKSRGAQIIILSRTPTSYQDPQINVIQWDGKSDLNNLPPQIDLLINLAGENIASGYWTKRKKQKIYQSRVLLTKQLIEGLSKISSPPKQILSASGINFYGGGGERTLDESSSIGSGFLATLCQEWEEQARKATRWGANVATLRLGVVLSARGGVLKQMLPIFRLGLGGRFGDGTQYMSWISEADLLRAILFIIDNHISGTLNICSPFPVQNKDFVKAVAYTVRRPAFFHLPRFFLELVLGQMAKELLLTSSRVIPNRLLNAGFLFKQPSIEAISEIVRQR